MSKTIARPDPLRVAEIMREVAVAEIMPLYQQLKAADITEKSPGDLVTIADVAAETRLEEALCGLVSGSVAVGEEAAEADPRVLDALSPGRQAPVWVIDPLDGTRNFAHGHGPFCVIVAFCQGGQALMGWIHDPTLQQTVWAEKGQGAWIGDRRISLAAPPPMADMKGSLSPRIARRLEGKPGAPRDIVRQGCAGRDYLDLALGSLDFARFAFRLKPWDHAAGCLIYEEAGGSARLLKDRAPYRADLNPQQAARRGEVLLLTPSPECGQILQHLLEEN